MVRLYARTPSWMTQKKYGVFEPVVVMAFSCARTILPVVAKEPFVKTEMSFNGRSTGVGLTVAGGAARGLLTTSALGVNGEWMLGRGLFCLGVEDASSDDILFKGM